MTTPVGQVPQNVPPRKVVQELPILLGPNLFARVQFPMSEEAYDLLIKMLDLNKSRLVETPATPAPAPEVPASV